MLMELLRRRRSIRKYRKSPVDPETVRLLVEAALRAPSSRGINPWEFVVVSDPAVLRILADAKPHGGSFLADAPLAIVVCAEAERSDVWIEDASIATTLILLAAESMGLGACWIQIRNRSHESGGTAEQFVRSTLGIPDRLSVLSVVALGEPDETKPPHPDEDLMLDRIHAERYGNAWQK